MSNPMETIELADQVDLDVFGLGEHHRLDLSRLRLRSSRLREPHRRMELGACLGMYF
jgi:hypothetical protein